MPTFKLKKDLLSQKKHEKDWFKERRYGRLMQLEKRYKKSGRSSEMHPATFSHWGLNRIKTGLIITVMTFYLTSKV